MSNSYCFGSGQTFAVTEIKKELKTGIIECRECGRKLKLQNHMRNPSYYKMVPRHKFLKRSNG